MVNLTQSIDFACFVVLCVPQKTTQNSRLHHCAARAIIFILRESVLCFTRARPVLSGHLAMMSDDMAVWLTGSWLYPIIARSNTSRSPLCPATTRLQGHSVQRTRSLLVGLYVYYPDAGMPGGPLLYMNEASEVTVAKVITPRSHYDYQNFTLPNQMYCNQMRRTGGNETVRRTNR